MLIKDQQKKLSLQYITNDQGEKTAVILPIEQFEEHLNQAKSRAAKVVANNDAQC